jgi:hypothetical protein
MRRSTDKDPTLYITPHKKVQNPSNPFEFNHRVSILNQVKTKSIERTRKILNQMSRHKKILSHRLKKIQKNLMKRVKVINALVFSL